MEIEVDVEVAFGVEFVGDSGGGLVRLDIVFAFVAEETREGLVHGPGEFRLARLIGILLACG